MREFALAHGIRVIGVDRPGIGSSTPHLYANVLDWAGDLELLMDTLGIETACIAGLSGGGPYALAAAVGLPGRIRRVGVMGGVAPTVGPDAAEGGLIQIAAHLARQNMGQAARFELDSYNAILAMVAEGEGWTILTPLALHHAALALSL